MSTHLPSFLSVLQSHARERGELLAHLLPDRDITYRRLWSRTERASARLQGEWGVQAGDTVAYIGAGHPDAIVLYFALLRIGASLLPLEAMTPADARAACTLHCPSLLVHDDEVPAATLEGWPAQALDMLLDDWCHFDPVLVPDDSQRASLWLPGEAGEREMLSLYQLTADLPHEARSGWVNERIFTAEVLGRLVLPALRDARRLYFAATEPQQRTGS